MISILMDEINKMKGNKNHKNNIKEIDEDINDVNILESELKDIDKEINKLKSKKDKIQQKIHFEKYKNSIINKNKYENAIIIPIKVNNNELFTDIYFLNGDKLDSGTKTIIFINGIKQEDSKYYFCPKKLGLYTIIIKFNTKIKNCENFFLVVIK